MVDVKQVVTPKVILLLATGGAVLAGVESLSLHLTRQCEERSATGCGEMEGCRAIVVQNDTPACLLHLNGIIRRYCNKRVIVEVCVMHSDFVQGKI